jgi:hypothetical protein
MTLLALPILAAILAQPEPEPVVAPIEPISRVLVDRALTQRNVRLLTIDAQSVRVIDEQGRTQSVPRSEVLAILPALTLLDPPFVPEAVRRSSRPNITISGNQTASQPLNPPALGRLELTDGQVLPGNISSSVTKDAVSWNSRLWGSVTVPLENAAAIVLTPDRFDALLAGARGTQDLILLGNGDRVEGFLESIDASVVRLERTGKASEIVLSRVDGVLLANPIKPAGGAWAWVSGAAAAITNVSLTDTGTFVIAGRLPGSKTQPHSPRNQLTPCALTRRRSSPSRTSRLTSRRASRAGGHSPRSSPRPPHRWALQISSSPVRCASSGPCPAGSPALRPPLNCPRQPASGATARSLLRP